MLESEKSLNEIKAKESELKAELARLSTERNKAAEQFVRDKIQVAVVLSDKLFRSIYQGDVAKMFLDLVVMVKTIQATDPRAESRLNADGYGLNGGDAQRFFSQFVFPALVNNRGLSDVLEKTKKHVDNPYLKEGGGDVQ